MQGLLVPLVVFLTGGLGSVVRYGIGKWLNQPLALGGFPWGTLAVNLIGAFLITFIGGLLPVPDSKGGDTLRIAVMTGFLGGFTTFSAIQYETVQLLRSDAKLAWTYLGATYLLGGLLAALGFVLASRIGTAGHPA